RCPHGRVGRLPRFEWDVWMPRQIGSTWRSRATASRLARGWAWCTQPEGVLGSVTARGLDSRDGAYDAPRDLAVPPCSQHFDIRVITRPLKLCFERASI